MLEVFRYLDTRERLILQEEAYMLINIGLAKADVLYTGYRVYFRPLKKGVVLPLAVVKKG